MKILSFLLSLLSSLIILQTANAQNQDWNPVIKTHLSKHSTKFSKNAKQKSEYIISSMHTSAQSGLTHIYINQSLDGITIHNAITNISLNKNGEVFHSNDGFLDYDSFTNSKSVNIEPIDALARVAAHFNIQDIGKTKVTKSISGKDKQITMTNALVSNSDIKAKLIYVPDGKNLKLCWSVPIQKVDNNWWWDVRINAATGDFVDKISWTVQCLFDTNGKHDHNCKDHTHKVKKNTVNTSLVKQQSTVVAPNSYTVFAMPFEAPNETNNARTVETTPWLDAPNASPFGWHDDDGVTGIEYTITRGNNVHAYEDRDDDPANNPGTSPDGGPNLDFDFPLDLNTQSPVQYTDAAVTNLFYWNNIVHDVLAQYGFDEASGNFQQTNYSGVGLGGDYVFAEAQDGADPNNIPDPTTGSDFNNATFGTPPEGSNPIMQMFEWTQAGVPQTEFVVNSPGNITGNYDAIQSTFGPQDVVVTGDVVLAGDGGPTPNDGCEQFFNSFSKITLIDRGTCNFTDKVINAQTSQSLGVIICNNVATPISAPMGTSSTAITIPTIMISQSDCQLIKNELAAGNTVNTTMTLISSVPALNRDADFDNGVIAHEYGHGVSIRLTGGAFNTNCLSGSEQMGEGWSDYFSLILTMKAGETGAEGRGIGTYIRSQDTLGGGIRPWPYSTDLAINPATYNNITTAAVPHGVGTVWATMLWEMTWALIDVYGFDTDFYNGTGGNNIALQLVTEALKLQPCGPGFVTGRDAILEADIALYGGVNQCVIWEAFAKRGLGVSADQGTVASATDGTEAFDTPNSCLFINKSVSNEEAEDGDVVTYTITISNSGDTQVTGVTIDDILDPNLNYIPNSLSCSGSLSGSTLTINIGTIPPTSSVICTFDAFIDVGLTNDLIFDEDVENGANGWTVAHDNAQDVNDWVVDTNMPNSGSNAWYATEIGWPQASAGPASTMFLESPAISLAGFSTPALSFYHFIDTEAGWDGGFVQVSNDGGISWTNLTAADWALNGYDGPLGAGSNANIAGVEAFSGLSAGYINSIADLSAYAGQTINLRFVFGEDNNTGGDANNGIADGWYIDDIQITDNAVASIPNSACFTTNQGDNGCDDATVSVTPCSTNCGVLGCMDPLAHNFDSMATIDDGTCVTCSDNVQNGDENGIDCGGSNPNCPVCPSCTDGIMNGDETGVDCGGSCALCDCTDATLTYTGALNIPNNTDKRVDNWIILDGSAGAVQLPGSRSAELRAGNYIEVLPNFNVNLGASILLDIEPCNPSGLPFQSPIIPKEK